MKNCKRIYDEFGRITNFAENYPTRDISGTKLNFLGFMKKYLGKENEKGTISCNWNSDTFNSYITNIYENKILPNINLEKALEDFEEEDTIELFSRIKHRKEISDDTLYICREKFWVVYRAAIRNNEFDDKLFWDAFAFNTEKEERKDNAYKKIRLTRKSLSFDEEIKLIDFFMKINPEEEDGATYGVLLMFCIGLRNAESAGLSFKDIVEIPDMGFSSLFIYKTTEGDTNTIKAGGKTDAAAREIPLYPFLLEILNVRKEAIISSLIKKGSNREEAEEIVSDYPICCRKTNFEERCSRDDITKKGRALLMGINNSENEQKEESLRNASMSELTSVLAEHGIDIKDSTAYLFRRNQATHYYTLGLTASEIQYIIGHKLEDPNELRSYFVNPEKQKGLYNKLLKHPFNSLFGKQEKEEIITLKPMTRNSVRIIASEPNQKVFLKADRASQNNSITVIKSDAILIDGKYKREVDIHSISNEVYKKIKEKLYNEKDVDDSEGLEM